MFNQMIKQQRLEELYNKNQCVKRIKEEIYNFQDGYILTLIKEAGLTEKFGVDLLVQMIIHKRANIETLVGTLQHHAQDSLQEVVDNIELAVSYGLVEYSDTTQQFIVAVELPDEVQQEINEYQYPLPMVVPPNKVRHNRESGYLTVPTSILLKKAHHDDDVVLDHINRANSIPFVINEDVVNFLQNKWKGIDKKKDGESVREFQKRKKAFVKYDRDSRAVIQLLVENSEVIYFTHRYDFRGRIYCQGYHVNYAGNDWNKACLELANAEVVHG